MQGAARSLWPGTGTSTSSLYLTHSPLREGLLLTVVAAVMTKVPSAGISVVQDGSSQVPGTAVSPWAFHWRSKSLLFCLLKDTGEWASAAWPGKKAHNTPRA